MCSKCPALLPQGQILPNESRRLLESTDSTSVDKERATDVASVKPLICVSPSIPLSTFQIDGFDGCSVWWVRNLLDGCIHRAMVNVPVDISDKWCPGVRTGTSMV